MTDCTALVQEVIEDAYRSTQMRQLKDVLLQTQAGQAYSHTAIGGHEPDAAQAPGPQDHEEAAMEVDDSALIS